MGKWISGRIRRGEIFVKVSLYSVVSSKVFDALAAMARMNGSDSGELYCVYLKKVAGQQGDIYGELCEATVDI